MKEIKAINNEKKELYAKETRNSSIPVNAEMEPIYETSYSYEETREQLKTLNERCLKIKAYDIAKAVEDLKKVREEITFLQVAIDKINLTSTIDVD